ncbi:small ribosomal subunit Rsm22 family protein [Oryzobacter telluris]|uniref:small ribosomal subunit Rsm22 family protein n=1 Tax=Oryzobacter telluris TaxID=3149179 RepID=UPI00370D3B99
MSAPLPLALDAVLDGLPADALRRATATLIEVYRSGAPPTAQVLRDPVTAAAYAAYRMPATHAAVARALRHVTDLVPAADLGVRSLVDLGGGTGAATWAVADAFPDLERATVLDGSPDALDLGRRIAGHGDGAVASATWDRMLIGANPVVPQADLVTLSYVLGELDDSLHTPVIDAVAAAARLTLVIEPGTPRGYAAVLAARDRLVAAGWHLVAPCPQDGPCPVAARDDWCHFSVRLDRSGLHRRVKGGALGYEDEKFSYVLASRDPLPRAAGRVLRHPVTRKGLVQLEVCDATGSTERVVVTRRSGTAYRTARDTSWGDAWPPEPALLGSVEE